MKTNKSCAVSPWEKGSHVRHREAVDSMRRGVEREMYLDTKRQL